MALVITHAFVSGKADGVDPTLVQPSYWNAALAASMATGKILGRTTAATGPVEEIPLVGTGNVVLASGIIGSGAAVLAPGFLSAAGDVAAGAQINTSAASGATTPTIPLPAGSSIVVIHQSGVNGSGGVLCIADNQAGFCGITPIGTTTSSGVTNIASIQAVAGGFTITCLGTGAGTNFTGSVISCG